MALHDYEGEPIVGGTWKYAGGVATRITIIARDYDQPHLQAVEDFGEVGEPTPLGPDGRLYFVKNTSCPAQRTLEGAKAWANAQPWGPVTWDDEV